MLQQLHSKRLQIEKFVYEKGTNVALYNAEHSKEYQAFQDALQRALMAQIEYIADYKTHIPLLANLAKSQSSPLQSQVGVLLAQVALGNDINLAAYLVWAGTQGGQAALDKTGIYGIFGLKDQALIDYFKDYSTLIIKGVDRYTKEWIAGKIQEGKDKGLTPFEIQELLIDDGKGITAIRAERIVLTETANAMKVIENEAAKRMGIQTMIWRTSLDERVCEICGPLEGKEKAIGKTYPGGYDGPPAHVSCRCYEEQVIPDDWQMPENIWLGE